MWSARTTNNPAIYELLYNDALIASAWWLHQPQHPAVVVARIVDRLNLPAAECAPSTRPTWSMVPFVCNPETIPAAWQNYLLDGVESLALVWEKLPARLDEWNQRVLDALNTGRGLPAVELVRVAA